MISRIAKLFFPRLIAVAGLALAVFLMPVKAQAACTVTVASGTSINFGTWQQVSSGSQTADVTTADVRSGTGTYLYGTTVHGTLTLTNNPQCSGTLTITAADGGGVSGITLSNFHLNYNGAAITNGQSGLALGGNGAGKTLLVGATATFSSAVPIGTASPTLQITALETSGKSGSATQTETIGIDAPISFVKLSDIDFGDVSSTTVSTYRMSTAGVESVVSGAGQIFSGTPTAANITIKGSATDSITIQATGYTADKGVTPANATCAYNGGAAVSCNSAFVAAPPTTTGKTLLVGVDVAADGTQAGGSAAAPSFSILVNYQ